MIVVATEIDFAETDDHIDEVREWEDDTDCWGAYVGGVKSAAGSSKVSSMC